MFESEEWLAIIRKLIRLTEMGKLSWVLNDHGALIAEVEGIEYVVRPQDWDNLPPWVLAVLNANDDSDPIATITSAPGDADEDPQAMLFKLRALAHREATGSGQLARKLIEALDRLDEPDVF